MTMRPECNKLAAARKAQAYPAGDLWLIITSISILHTHGGKDPMG